MQATVEHDAIRAMARAVAPAAMMQARKELGAIESQRAALCEQIQAEDSIARGLFQSPLKPVSIEDRQAAQLRLDRINAEVARLDRRAAAERENIRRFAPENTNAVRAAICPMRKAVAARVTTLIDELSAAIEALNATGECLKDVGVNATLMPLPLFSGMREIARSILAAERPEFERR